MGMPGSFHGCLFPDGFLHFVHSSFSLQILSRVPNEVVDKSSPARNKGRIQYANSLDEVFRAYEAQYEKDMERFLNARSHSEAFVNMTIDLLGSSLVDMARKGMLSEEKVDSFNIPTFNASLGQVEAIVKRNGCFRIEILKSLPQEKPQPKVLSSTMRACIEGMIKQHFGYEILDEMFELLSKKFEEPFSSL
ncbi:loganic acid O-methyltransferase-like [Ziziphus jujuba]|uniref:Loganic acid O-methyltransferase-like n=1 Tax=Ziziphus jujuba TaxID=326968 RepID=A0ABM4A2M8_ZIZJJ|nr:loganic acid O-methyltransferase-like [Ziziphus jujuba]